MELLNIKNKPIIERLECPLSREEVFSLFAELRDTAFLNSSLSSDAGRYSFIGLDPFLNIKTKDTRIETTDGEGTFVQENNPFEYLRSIFDRYNVSNDTPFPFIAGGMGCFSYDLKNMLEDLPRKAIDDLGMPDICFNFYRTILIFDEMDQDHVYVSVLDSADWDAGKTINNVKEKLSKGLSECQSVRVSDSRFSILDTRYSIPDTTFSSNFTKQEYLDAVEQVKEHIRAGDIYQACLSQRFRTRSSRSARDLYLALNKINPAPFSAFLNTGDIAIISSSPELFLRRRGDIIETRPMKGTRPRGLTPQEDYRIRGELEKSPKDISELLMIVDLERNDLGRIALPGTVKVTEPRRIESYSTVFQTIAVIQGTVKQDTDNIDIIKAAFPGGSIAGCPKIRAMEIIDSIEPTARGAYTGAMGYLSFHDTMDLNIAIRTMIKKGDDLYFQVGGGIVAESDPEGEYEETLVKARAMMRAVTG